MPPQIWLATRCRTKRTAMRLGARLFLNTRFLSVRFEGSPFYLHSKHIRYSRPTQIPKASDGKRGDGSLCHADVSDGRINRSWAFRVAQIRRGLLGSKAWPVEPGSSSNCKGYIQSLIDDCPEPEQRRAAYLHLPRTKRDSVWSMVMLECMASAPFKALQLLEATINVKMSRPPTYMIIDSLEILATWRSTEETEETRETHWIQDVLYRMVMDFLPIAISDDSPQPSLDALIHRLSRCLQVDQLESLVQLLFEHDISLHVDTALDLLSKCINHGLMLQAVQILRQVSASEQHRQSEAVQRACTRIIGAPYRVPNRHMLQTKLVVEILDLGIRPGTGFLNQMLYNALRVNQAKLMLEIFRSMKMSSIAPDERTYRLLLAAASRKITDRVTRQALVDAARPLVDSGRQEPSINCFLTRAARARTSEWSFPQFLAIYQQHFDIQPLQTFVGANYRLGSDSTIKTLPSARILGRLCFSFLQHYEGTVLIEETYERYQNLIRQGDPSFIELSKATYTANAFIMAFGQKAESLPMCVKVIADMIANNHVSSSTDGRDGKEAYQCAKPDVHSWSILMHAYFRHGQIRAAEKVQQLIHERGLTPSKVTWNILLQGYLTVKLPDGAIQTRQRMIDAGCRPRKRLRAFYEKAIKSQGTLEQVRESLAARFRELAAQAQQAEDRATRDIQGEHESQAKQQESSTTSPSKQSRYDNTADHAAWQQDSAESQDKDVTEAAFPNIKGLNHPCPYESPWVKNSNLLSGDYKLEGLSRLQDMPESPATTPP